MKVFTFFAVISLGVFPAAWAQPVRDLVDAQEAVRAHMRDMQPAVEQVREMALLLQAFANVQRELSDATQPGVAIDKARSALDDYATDATRRGAPLDRENRAMIEWTRRELEAAHNGAAFVSLTDLREKIHHNAIHPLQRRTLQMTRHVELILRSYEALANMFRTPEMAAIGNLERLAIDPEKP